MRVHPLLGLPLLALLAGAPAGAAELYKWVDDNGVVNYSNTPPPKTRSGKPPTVIEDRVSTYTPDKATLDEIERAKRRPAPPTPAASLTRDAPPRVTAPPPPPPVAYDPCANPNDPNCQHYLYDGSPVFQGRRRPPVLVQPQLPPGTIAGQGAGPGAYIPGQSGQAAPVRTPPQRPSTGNFSVREPERDRDAPRR